MSFGGTSLEYFPEPRHASIRVFFYFMAKIIPQVNFSKVTFIYWIDSHVEGTIVLPDIDISSIKSIRIDHIISYGISSDKKNPFEGFDHWSEAILNEEILYSSKVPLHSLSFRIPIVYPNIRKTDTISFDEDYSLIQNILSLTIEENTFFSINDKKKVIMPIEWPRLTDNSINYYTIHKNLKNKNVVNQEKNKILDSKMIPSYISLPWNKWDFVSERYYKNIVETYKFAKLWDILYSNSILKMIYFIIILLCFTGFIMLIFALWNHSSWAEFFEEIVTISFSIFIWSSIYLILQFLPKYYLKRKISIDEYLPVLRSLKSLCDVLILDKIQFKDLFQEFKNILYNQIVQQYESRELWVLI